MVYPPAETEMMESYGLQASPGWRMWALCKSAHGYIHIHITASVKKCCHGIIHGVMVRWGGHGVRCHMWCHCEMGESRGTTQYSEMEGHVVTVSWVGKCQLSNNSTQLRL